MPLDASLGRRKYEFVMLGNHGLNWLEALFVFLGRQRRARNLDISGVIN